MEKARNIAGLFVFVMWPLMTVIWARARMTAIFISAAGMGDGRCAG